MAHGQKPRENVSHFQVHRSSFKVVIRKVEKPFSSRPADELDWICQTLGFYDSDAGRGSAAQLFREIVRQTESGNPSTSTALAEHLGLSRGAIINHLNNLMRSGLVVKNGRYYVSRSRSLFRTIEEIEGDIERIFLAMKETAMEIDEELGVGQQEQLRSETSKEHAKEQTVRRPGPRAKSRSIGSKK